MPDARLTEREKSAHSSLPMHGPANFLIIVMDGARYGELRKSPASASALTAIKEKLAISLLCQLNIVLYSFDLLGSN